MLNAYQAFYRLRGEAGPGRTAVVLTTETDPPRVAAVIARQHYTEGRNIVDLRLISLTTDGLVIPLP